MAGANMKRNQDLAGMSVKQGNYTVTYDDLGYAVRASRDGGASATDVARTTHSNDSANHQAAYQAAQAGDWDTAASYINKISEAGGLNKYGTYDAKNSNDYWRELQNEFGYNANDYYNGLYDKAYGAGSSAVYDATGGAIKTYQDLVNAIGDGAAQNFLAQQPTAKPNQVNVENLFNSMMSANQSAVPNETGGYYTGAAAAPTYGGSQWDSVLDSLANQLISMNYNDWTQGDQYAALANRYGQQGRMSMQDVLGQIASRTGGLASSYATTAAQQQYNNYMAQLEDAAREMYGVEQGELLDKAQMAQQYANEDYNRYLDEWNQWADNRDFSYDAYRDSVADQMYQQEWEYGLAQQEQKEQADMAETMAGYGDFSGYAALGYTPEQIAIMEAAYQAQNAPRSSGGGGTTAELDLDGLYRYAYENGGFDVAKQASIYKQYGLTSAPTQSGYNDWVKNNTYTDADVSAIAKGLATDIKKYHGTSQQDMLDAVDKAYEGGILSQQDYLYLLDQLGL